MEVFMDNVLLVSSPFYRLQGSHYNGANLGLAYLSAVLEQEGIQCDLYNADFLQSDIYANQKELFAHYGDYKLIMNQTDHAIWRECVMNILAYHPTWLGFSMYTANVKAVKILSHLIKKTAPDVKIVVGGPHVTLAKGKVLEELENVDFAIYGEAEKSLLSLILQVPYRKIRGLIFRNQGQIVVNGKSPFIENLDELPFPNRNRFYIINNQRIGDRYIMTSRGCPNNCSFCASPVIWERKVRFRSVENIIQELIQMKDLGYTFIQFQDDTFTFRKSRLLNLLRRMLEEEFDFQWTCDTRLTNLDNDILTLMKDAGCIRIKAGIESGNRDILRSINKGLTPETVIEKTALIKEVGLSLTAYFMIGFPGESEEQALDTIELAKKIQADYYSLSVVAPYYGTPLYQNFISNDGYKRLKDHWEYFFHQSQELILTTGISKDTIDDFMALNEYGKGIRI